MRKGVRLPVLLLLLLRLITLCSVAFVRQAAARLHDNGKALHRQPQSDSNGEQEEEFHVIIGIKEEYRGLGILLRLSRRIRPRFRRANALSAIVKKSELERLMSDPDISYVEEDAMVYPDDNNGNNILMKFEAILYGVSMVQGGVQESIVPITPTATDATATSDRSGDSTTMRHAAAACSNPDSFKIGIIDSGLAINHPDIPCLSRTHNQTNCIGKEFGLEDGDGVWYNPMAKYHGTHVAGTIGATQLDNTTSGSIHGVIPDGNICFVIGRVFGESGATGTRMSAIFEAVEWMVDVGVKVINMSLGGAVFNSAGDEIMAAAYKEGVLLVAASGNDGTSEVHYPANYKNVLSVAAVDESKAHATFSQYNSGVDIAGPGVEILSTVPLHLGGVVMVTSPSVTAVGSMLEFSQSATNNISGVIVDCPNFGSEPCMGDGGHICLIERGGGVTFEQKAHQCELGGGLAVIIYNNVAGYMSGGLSNATAIQIPAVQTTAVDGQRLKAASTLGQSVSVQVKKGYGYLSGTSMAVPHVTGVIGKIWRACPQCSNQQVESCLLSTAMDLGEPGKDILFGQGLVQANDAYLCLIYTAQCCETDNLPPTNAPIVATPSPSTVESWESPPIQWVVSGDNLVSMSSTTTVGV